MSKERIDSEYPVNSLIASRWSPRAFSDKVPSDEQLLKLVEAARWAPSSFNEQPWRFIVGVSDKGDSHSKVYQCLNEFNQEWAAAAPVLLIICCKEDFSHNNKANRHHMYDSGAAMANLCVQATADELVVHQMAGFHPKKAKETFNIPDGYRAITAAAIGFLGEPESLNEKNQKSETTARKRKRLKKLCFIDEWENSFS